MGTNSKKVNKAERRKKIVRLIQAIIVLIIVLAMIISVIAYSFGN